MCSYQLPAMLVTALGVTKLYMWIAVTKVDFIEHKIAFHVPYSPGITQQSSTVNQDQRKTSAC